MFGEGERAINESPRVSRSSSDADDGKKQADKSNPFPTLPLPPLGMLIVYICINLLAYCDRGVLSGSLKDISRSYGELSDFKQGFLASAFMGGYMVASPIFASLAGKYEPFRCMAAGLFIWSIGTACTGLSPYYELVAFARIITGFGEAAFLCIAPAFIDKVAPRGRKGAWLSAFYTTIPVGYALGFFISGLALGKSGHWLGKEWTWRALFIGEGCIMIPFVLFCLRGKSPFFFKQTPPEDTLAQVAPLESPLLSVPPVAEEEEEGGETKPVLYPHDYIHPDPSYANAPHEMHLPHHHHPHQRGRQSQIQQSNFVPPDDVDVNVGVASTSYSAIEGSTSFANPTPKKELPVVVTAAIRAPRTRLEEVKQIWEVIVKNPIYTLNVFAYAAQTYVTGGFAFFGLKYVNEVLKLEEFKAGIYFGAVTVFTGIFGTLFGGTMLDYLRRKMNIPSAKVKNPFDKVESSESERAQGLLDAEVNPLEREEVLEDEEAEFEKRRNNLRDPDNVRDRIESIVAAERVILWCNFLSIPFAVMAFALPGTTAFFLCLLVAEFLLFASFSPVNNTILWSVPFQLAPQGMALSVIITHVLGDALSPSVIGAMNNAMRKRHVMIVTALFLVPAQLIWIWAYYRSVQLMKVAANHSYSSEYQGGSQLVPGAKHVVQPITTPISFVRRVLRWHLMDADVDSGETSAAGISPSEVLTSALKGPNGDRIAVVGHGYTKSLDNPDDGSATGSLLTS